MTDKATLGGESQQTRTPRKRHDTPFLFHASADLIDAARAKAEADGVSLAHACRRGLQLYLRASHPHESGAVPPIGLELGGEG